MPTGLGAKQAVNSWPTSRSGAEQPRHAHLGPAHAVGRAIAATIQAVSNCGLGHSPLRKSPSDLSGLDRISDRDSGSAQEEVSHVSPNGDIVPAGFRAEPAIQVRLEEEGQARLALGSHSVSLRQEGKRRQGV
jgi:hypothetical protein